MKQAGANTRWKLYTAAFAAPVLLLAAVYAVAGFAPFGEKTLLTVDMNGQYVAFFSQLRSILLGKDDLLYTFGKALGGDMIGLFAYYIASPLNLLVVFFPVRALPWFVLLLTLLKTGLAGVSLAAWARRHTGPRKALCLCVLYALCTYSIAYQQNILWLDGVILLPLMALGIERIVEGGRPWLYLGSLAMGILTDYYIGYMLCIFSVLYFLFYALGGFGARKAPVLPMLATYAGASLLAAGLAAVLLLPALASLQGNRFEFGTQQLASLEKLFSLRALLAKETLGAYEWTELEMGLPPIYCGALALLGAGMFFLQKRPVRQKAAAGAVAAVFVLSFWLKGPNLIWHGFNPPAWFNYRNAFLFSFFVLVLAAFALEHLWRDGQNPWLCAGGVAVCALALGWACAGEGAAAFTTARRAAVSLALVAAVGLLWCLFAAGKRRRVLCLAMAALCAADISLNAFLVVRAIDSGREYRYTPMEEYTAFVDGTLPAVRAVQAQDSTFYRMEKDFQYGYEQGGFIYRSRNDAMLLGYNGISHYSSSDKLAVKALVGALGFRNCVQGGGAYYYTGSTNFAASLLGIRYVLSQQAAEGDAYRGYTAVLEENGVTAWRNPSAFPLAFCAAGDAAGVDFSQQNLFELQNELFCALTGETQPLLTPLAVQEEVHEMTESAWEGVRVFDVNQEGGEGWVEFRVTAQADGPLYCYFPTDRFKPARMYVNGEDFGRMFDTYTQGITYLGMYEAGDTVAVRLVPEYGMLRLYEPLFYTEDLALLQSACNAMQPGFARLEEVSSSHFKGDVTAQADGPLVISIPWEEGWTVEVDGQAVPTRKAVGELMAIDLTAGTHTLELRYCPPGLAAGAVLSAASAMLAGLWAFCLRKRARAAKGAEK